MLLVGTLTNDWACNIQVFPDVREPLYKANLTVTVEVTMSGRKYLIVLIVTVLGTMPIVKYELVDSKATF